MTSIWKFLILLTSFCCFQQLNCCGFILNDDSDQFYYFAFGSNMLGERLQINNPTAVRVGAAALENYRLDFDQLSNNWRGARATILPAENTTIFGVLWLIDILQIENLDRQESVELGIYAPKTVAVKAVGNITDVMARTYYLVDGIPENSKFDRRPSRTYLKCIVKGAEEANLPDHYIKYLKSIETNGIIAPLLEKDLKLEDVELVDRDHS